MSTPVTLTLSDGSRPGLYLLTCAATTYSIEFRPETDVVLRDLLRRLPPVLVGGADPSGQLGPVELLRAVGTRLWRTLLFDGVPPDARRAIEKALQADTPLLLALPPVLAVLPWELLCDPDQVDDAGFIARRRSLMRLVPGGKELPSLTPPLKVLLLISSPPEVEPHRRGDVESERAAVEEATRDLGETWPLHLLSDAIG